MNIEEIKRKFTISEIELFFKRKGVLADISYYLEILEKFPLWIVSLKLEYPDKFKEEDGG